MESDQGQKSLNEACEIISCKDAQFEIYAN